jgi:hypothetical protein
MSDKKTEHKFTRRQFIGATVALATISTPSLASPPKPGKAIDFLTLAEYPELWREKKVSPWMYPWMGRNIVFFTDTTQLDPTIIGIFLNRLDNGWKLYADLTGTHPTPYKMYKDKPTIAAVPEVGLNCGVGCSYVGATGMELCLFYTHDYPMVVKNNRAFAHYYFYEMGRNYYTFGNRHSLFITGYAVFMRYVCMDTLKCIDPNIAARKTIEACEEGYAKSDLPFLKAFTTLMGMNEKTPRLDIHPSDQPCMYASVMLKLYRENGKNAWLKRFFAALLQCPEVKPSTTTDALKQCANWLIAVNAAAKKDLTSLFVRRWRMPLPDSAREMLEKVAWDDPKLDVGNLCGKVDNMITV